MSGGSGSDELRGSGNAGCNNWNATVILRDDQIDFTNIVTTKKMCGKPTMTAEDAFLTSLRSAKRWHVDGDKLIIEGDAARLMLKPGVAELKPEETGQAPARKVIGLIPCRLHPHRKPPQSASRPTARLPSRAPNSPPIRPA